MKRSLLPGALVGGAAKWITASVTTVAAAAAVAANARSLGIQAWLGAHGLGFADYAPSRIVVTPAFDSLFAIGDTLVLTAAITNRHGAVLAGPVIRWQSERPEVAAVDSTGVVIAQGPGEARVIASLGKLASTARVVVRQRVVAVVIEGDTTLRLKEGDRFPLEAYGIDARGVRVEDRLVRWISSDSSVASVDSSGVLLARTPGRAVITAAVDSASRRAVVHVILAPGAITLEAGDALRVPAGRALPRPVVVRVLSRSGRPVPNAEVGFQPEDAEGVATPAVVRTDPGGRARTVWTLSPRPGRQRLLVRVEGLDSTLTLGVEADPVASNTRIEQIGSPPSGVVGAPLAEPVGIRVTDARGVALADVPVNWRTPEGGIIEPLADRTDSLGEAWARWTLGPAAGLQRARVLVGNPRTMPPFAVSVQAQPASPADLQVVAGGSQRGTAGRPLPEDVVVLVRDRFGNPVAGAPVQVRQVDGSVADSVVASDSTGRARVRWTLGRRAGLQRLVLEVAGAEAMVPVTARAGPREAANVTFVSPPAAAVAGRSTTLAVVVTDAYGNAVGDALVVFTASHGAVAPERVLTDQRGRAATRWVPAANPDQQTVTASVRGGPLRWTHRVRVRAANRPEDRTP
jgi:expansin (peptidoglycan-binding protein)